MIPVADEPAVPLASRQSRESGDLSGIAVIRCVFRHTGRNGLEQQTPEVRKRLSAHREAVLQGLLKVQHSFHALSCKWNRSQHGVGDILNYHHWQSYQTSDEVEVLPENISVFCLDGFFALLEMC